MDSLSDGIRNDGRIDLFETKLGREKRLAMVVTLLWMSEDDAIALKLCFWSLN